MTINVENARRLIKRLEDEDNPVAFHMLYWFSHNGKGENDPIEICDIVSRHPCGTVACLAGHAALEAWQSGDRSRSDLGSIQGVAQDWLGLEYLASRALFQGRWNDQALEGSLGHLTKEGAITELNRLIELHEEGTAT